MKAIIAVNNLGFIGKGNTLLWKNKEDLQHFKELTLDQVLLVGYNTNSELPPLPSRTVMLDEKDILNLTPHWCIGGKKTYEKYAPYFTELHISHINDNQIGDVVFPNLSKLNPDCRVFNYYF